MDVSVGPCTVNVRLPLVPPGVVMVTFLEVSAAPAVIVNVVVAVVAFTTVTAPTVTPPPETATVVPDVVKFVPVRVTGTDLPRTPVLGATEVSVGIGGAITVNASVFVAPIGVVTLTFLRVRPAVAEIVNVAVAVMSLTTVSPLTVIPPPTPVIAVAPVKPRPVKVT